MNGLVAARSQNILVNP